MAKLRIGTRGSQLALWQANHVAALLRAAGHEVEIEIIHTTGDRFADRAFSQVDVKGMFTKEIEEALAAGTIDLAVHSLKDLPTELAPPFAMGAVLRREDPRDALLSERFSSLAALPPRARIGTSSLRRESQLRALRADVEVLPVRGNVDTRLRKLQSGECEAIILAAAGVRRLGRQEHIRQLFTPEEMCSAAGQGAVAIELRKHDSATLACVQPLECAATRRSTDCERALLAALGGGCQVPIGAFAECRDGELHLLAKVLSRDGKAVLAEQGRGEDGAAIARELAARLLRRGAEKILSDAGRAPAAPLEQP